MYTETVPANNSALLGLVAVICTLVGGTVAAKAHEVTVAISVSTKGFNLNRAEDAQSFYTRLKNAAWVACTRGNRVNLKPVDDLQDCYEKALASAIRSLRAPLITRIYLETHPLQQAAKHGIGVPAQLAAK